MKNNFIRRRIFKYVFPVGIICFIFFALTTRVEGQSKDAKDSVSGPEIFFKNTEHNFDTITKGPDASWEFTFTNTGNEPLKLEKIRTSCQCTVSKWSKKKILPGKSDVIKVIYSTRNVGYFHRTITIMSNAKTNPIELHITGTVLNK
jgi:hypothetical protein